MRLKNVGFTLVELMVVIMIVGVLASVMVPMMKARVDKSKWSEACTSAGTIRSSIRNYCVETSVDTAKALAGTNLGNTTAQDSLGFTSTDLEGTYFSAGDYYITSINSNGIAVITVVGGSKDGAPSGSFVLKEDGSWEKQ